MTTTNPDRKKDQAQAPFTPSFVRLGRSVWFTLESAHRADKARAAALEKRLAMVGAQFKDVSRLGFSLMAVGDWNSRQTWSEEQWKAFLRDWRRYAPEAFDVGDDETDDDTTPEDERKLMDLFNIYCTFYACLPDRPAGAPPADTDGYEHIQAVGQRVDEALGVFYARLGDPVQACHVCGKCALGYKPKRCSRCKRQFYCSQDCQKQHWTKGRHKKTCVPIAQQNPVEVAKLVQNRYKLLRRHGKDPKEAMQMARAEYDRDKYDVDAGTQVAAMFGIS